MTLPDNWKCAAYGCPLPGGQSMDRGPGIKYYCRFHANASMDEWDRISFAINQNIDRLRDLYQLHNAPYNQSRSRFVDPIPGETGHEYRMRVEMIVRNLVINGVAPESKSANPELENAA